MNTEHGGMNDQAPVGANPNNLEENDYQIAQRAQMIDDRIQDEILGRQLQNDEDEARRPASINSIRSMRDENCQCCIVM